MKILFTTIGMLFVLNGCDNNYDELQSEIDELEEIVADQERIINELQVEIDEATVVLSDEIDTLRNDFMENASAELSELMGVEVIFDDPESIDFGLIDRGYVWAQGRWESAEITFAHVPRTVNALFRYSGQVDGQIVWQLEVYNFGRGWGIGDLDIDHPRISRLPGIRKRYFDMDVVPVRFYHDYNGLTGFEYVEEELSGEYFAVEMIEFVQQHLDRHIVDLWLIENRLYVNFHPEEFPGAGSGGDEIAYQKVLLTLTSIPDIDEIVVMTGSVREPSHGAHAGSFADVYRVDDPRFYEWRTRYDRLVGNVVSLSVARSHTLALMEDGTLWSWGGVARGWDGSLLYSNIGDGTMVDRLLPVQIMEDVTFAVAGHSHSFAITDDGVLWAWGGNDWGQLGDGTTEDRLSPVRIMDDVIYVAMPSTVPNSHSSSGARSYAITADGILWAWGANDRVDAYMVVLGDGTEEESHYPVPIMENVVSVVPTHSGGFAITNDGVLWNWHSAYSIRNENDDDWIQIEAQLYPVPIMEDVASVSDRLVIRANGELWSLGYEPVWIMSDVVYATRSGGASFAITTDGALWAWGLNQLPGQWQPRPLLGDGTTVDRDEPVRIMEDVASVMVMGNVAYAITMDSTLWAWGYNSSRGIIGDGVMFVMDDVEDFMWEYAYRDISPASSGIRWLLDDDDGTGLRLFPVPILENVVDVSASFYLLDHGWVNSFRTFALTECGSVYGWGNNDVFSYGWSLLGDGTSENRLYPVRIIDGE